MNGRSLLINSGSVFSVLLRILLLSVKFAFTIALAHYTSATTVGIYALVEAVTTIAIYFIGAELHTHVIREIVVAAPADRSLQLQNHIAFVCLFFIIGLPISWATICWLRVDGAVPFVLFSMVLFGEMLCQELTRYLNALGHPISSNTLQFLRAAAWMPVAILCFKFGNYPPLSVTLACWASGCFVAIAYGMSILRAHIGPLRPVSGGWLRLALQDTRYYFVVAVLAQIQAYADRLIVQKNLGAEYVGQLTFFQNFANTVQGFVLTGVVSIALPELLALARKGMLADAAKVSRRMLIGGSIVALSVSVCVMLGVGAALSLVGKSEYSGARGLLPWMLLGNYFIILGQVQHYRLYALRKDRTLMLIAVATTPLALIINLIATQQFGLRGTVASFVAVSLLQTMIKWRIANQFWPHTAAVTRV